MFEFKATPRTVNLLNPKRHTDGARMIAPLEKERAYVQREELRAKVELLSRKIEDFRMKKNTSPFDLTFESKFRVQPNLSFFLNDQKILAGEEKKNTAMQTDLFRKKVIDHETGGSVRRPGRVEGFVEKKTGKDEGAQVDLDELFDYGKAVKPIVGVLVTKILEQGLLEVEEEIEIANMLKVKDEYINNKQTKEHNERDKFMLEEKKKMMNFDAEGAKQRELDLAKRKQTATGIVSVCTKYLLGVVDQIIDTIEEEKAVGTKDSDIVKFIEQGLKVMNGKLTSKIETRRRYETAFDLFLSNLTACSMKDKIPQDKDYRQYLNHINKQ